MRNFECSTLEYVQKVLGLSVSGLARVFGVSRQSVYLWKDGGPIGDENARRLGDLARAADVFARNDIAVCERLLRRPIRDGLGLIELLHSGVPAEESAGKLVAIIQREAEERRRLSERVAGRPRVDFSEAGVPHLVEEEV